MKSGSIASRGAYISVVTLLHLHAHVIACHYNAHPVRVRVLRNVYGRKRGWETALLRVHVWCSNERMHDSISRQEHAVMHHAKRLPNAAASTLRLLLLLRRLCSGCKGIVITKEGHLLLVSSAAASAQRSRKRGGCHILGLPLAACDAGC